MSEFSNDLTPAEVERLSILMEEMGEVAQVIGKVLRHGYKSVHPASIRRGHPTNRELLERELGDLTFAINFLCANGDVDKHEIQVNLHSKMLRVEKYLHHNDVSKLA